jgi:hypothetical protein
VRWLYLSSLAFPTDAVFVNATISPERFMNESYALVGCRGGLDPQLFWDVNIGVLFYNLRHPDMEGRSHLRSLASRLNPGRLKAPSTWRVLGRLWCGSHSLFMERSRSFHRR